MQNATFDDSTILAELSTIKNYLLQNTASKVSTDWIPKKDLMKFLNYGDTQMAALLHSGELTVSTVGKRKFIHRPSFIKFLEKNIQ